MSYVKENDMTAAEATDRIWELADQIGTCMFVTWDGERQRARPLVARVTREEHALFFLTDVDGMKDDQIEEFPTVTMAFADVKSNKYVAVTGRASVSNDRARIEALWNPGYKAFWESSDDPGIRVITVVPEDAELWDSPNRLVAGIKMAAAAVTGAKVALGENRKVVM